MQLRRKIIHFYFSSLLLEIQISMHSANGAAKIALHHLVEVSLRKSFSAVGDQSRMLGSLHWPAQARGLLPVCHARVRSWRRGRRIPYRPIKLIILDAPACNSTNSFSLFQIEVTLYTWINQTSHVSLMKLSDGLYREIFNTVTTATRFFRFIRDECSIRRLQQVLPMIEHLSGQSHL